MFTVKDCHDRLPQLWVWPASCVIWIITNSAGFSGAKPTRMLTTPLSMSVWVVVVASHWTRNASDGVRPLEVGALPEQGEHERLDLLGQGVPQRRVVGLEHRPAEAAV